jgi:hypothetical protein
LQKRLYNEKAKSKKKEKNPTHTQVLNPAAIDGDNVISNESFVGMF